MKRSNFLQALGIGALSTTVLSHNSYSSSLLERLADRRDDDLSYHKISNIRFSDVRLQYPRLVGKNARLDLHGYGPRVEICVIETDKGATGWGSLRGSRRDAENIRAQLIGKKLSDVFATDVGILNDSHLAFDIALHDLAGVVLNKPVYAMLGQSEPIITDCYSGMIYFDDLEPTHQPGGVDRILEECRSDYDLGYRQFKLKIGRGHRWMPFEKGLARDIEVTKAVANAFPDCDILVDGNNGFSVGEFIQYLDGIAGVKLFWIEEPFHETVPQYEKLRAYLNKNGLNPLLADGEADADQQFLHTLIDKNLLDVHLTDIEELGFTNWRKLIPQLKKTKTLASPHAWGSLLKSYYTAHLAGGLGNVITIEGVSSTSEDVDLSGYRLTNGKLIPSSLPGFGMRLLKEV